MCLRVGRSPTEQTERQATVFDRTGEVSRRHSTQQRFQVKKNTDLVFELGKAGTVPEKGLNEEASSALSARV